MSESIHQILRWTHIAIGFSILVVFWIPVLSKKGGRLHIAAGKVYLACGWFLVLTAYVSCTWAIVSPASFMHFSNGIAPEFAATLRFFFVILFVLATWVLQGLVLGMDVLKLRRDPDVLSKGRTKPVCWYTFLVSVASGGFGVFQLVSGGGMRYIVFVVMGLIGTAEFRDSIAFIKNPRSTRMAWWYKHMECMLGTGIGFYTAFFVFGFTQLFGSRLTGWTVFIPWVLPSLLGIPLTSRWVRQYKRKFGELGESKSPATAVATDLPSSNLPVDELVD